MQTSRSLPDTLPDTGARPDPDTPRCYDIRGLHVRAGKTAILRDVNLRIPDRGVFGLIGPSGAGKSTLLSCLNRMVDLRPGLRVSGEILYRGQSLRGSGLSVDDLRRRVGMVFQQPVLFPGSIADNVLFGAKRVYRLGRAERNELLETSLREAALWDEVRDRLRAPVHQLSIGQRQRLCLARALAMDPEVVLMDEPTSALDAAATARIEDLIHQVKTTRAVVLVTHDVAQARRVTDWVACLCVRDGAGELSETVCCDALLDDPDCLRALSESNHT